MKRSEPLHYVWWLVSRASGIVALVLICCSALLGLTMAARILGRPAFKRNAARLHEHVALTALGAIAVHGLSLFGDQWLKPGIDGLVIPFAMKYRPAFTGLGILAGYAGALLGPSFYFRRRLGAARWRKVHRLTIVIWPLAAVHTLGAGSDAGQVWLRAVALSPVIPMVYLLVMRLTRKPERARSHGRDRRHTATAHSSRPVSRRAPSATHSL